LNSPDSGVCLQQDIQFRNLGDPAAIAFPSSIVSFIATAWPARDERLSNLREAIALILEHRREESLRALPPDASQDLIVVG